MSINPRTLAQRQKDIEGNQLNSKLLFLELPNVTTQDDGSFLYVLERIERADGVVYRPIRMTIGEFMYIFGTGGGAVDSVNGQTGVVVLNLDDINDVPSYENDGYVYVLTEENGVISWRLYESSPTTIPDGFTGLIQAVADGTYTLMIRAPFAGVINAVGAELGAGTCTITVRIGGTPLGGGATSVSTTYAETVHTSDNVYAVNDIITMEISASAGSPEDLNFVLKMTRVL